MTVKRLTLIKRGKGKRIILFSHEAGLCLHPKLGRIWAKKGKQPFILVKSQHHKRLNVFGWVNSIGNTHGIMRLAAGISGIAEALLGEPFVESGVFLCEGRGTD
jgi:hypothetical protein